MCIAVYKPVGQKMPNKDILKKCFENNDDGAGFMYCANGRVEIQKGFMSFNAFYKALRKTVSLNPEQTTPYVLHFRISTQGGKRADCTHPFPLSNNMKDLRKLKTHTNIGIAHNGIISLTSDYTKKKVDYNDTMVFIKEYLMLIIKNSNYYKDKNTLKLIEKLTTSKLAILNADGHCQLVGTWECDNGIFYSNDSYKDCGLNTMFPYSFNSDIENADEYEKYYVDGYGVYAFDIDNCPFFNEGVASYCEVCCNFADCWY